MNYGLPYKGSKNSIAERIVDILPPATHFYDVFAGGCAVTHAAMLTGKWKFFHVNDIDPIPIRLFQDAVEGKYKDEKRWIGRDDFKNLYQYDGYVRFCWSFGSNGRNYLYSNEIEPWKKALHFSRVYGDNSFFQSMGINTDGTRNDLEKNKDIYKRHYIEWYCRTYHSSEDIKQLVHDIENQKKNSIDELKLYLRTALRDSGLTQAEVSRRLGTQMSGHYFGDSQWEFPTREMYDRMRSFMPRLDKSYDEVYGLQQLLQSLERLQSLESLERLESLESLERLQRLQNLQSLQSLQRLEVTSLSYDDLTFEEDSVIYCDPPYKGTDPYGIDSTTFDTKKFSEWCHRQKELVVVSEYNDPDI
ncbi:MAG: DNA adenine methylase [Fibrobacter sp.]|nr:DNA adenine methylase [Fibrobacter sp.]